MYDTVLSMPEDRNDARNHLLAWCLRIFGTVVALAAYNYTFTTNYVIHMQKVTCVAFLTLGSIFITVESIFKNYALVYGVTMVLLLLSAIANYSGIHFKNAVVVSWLLILYYVIASWSIVGSFPSIVGFICAANIIFTSAAYYGEYHLRFDFINMLRQQDNERQSREFAGNMLPKEVLAEVQSNKLCFHEFPVASVLFCDIVQFTKLSSSIAPENVVAILNVMFSTFDQLTDTFSVYKVETIGDAYLACAGVVTKPPQFTQKLVMCGLAFVEVTSYLHSPDNTPIEIRIGVHTGSVIAGVVGRKMPRYHLFGETVTKAEDMESGGKKGYVCVSHQTLPYISSTFEVSRYTKEGEDPAATTDPEDFKYLVNGRKDGRGSISQDVKSHLKQTVEKSESESKMRIDSSRTVSTSSERERPSFSSHNKEETPVGSVSEDNSARKFVNRNVVAPMSPPRDSELKRTPAIDHAKKAAASATFTPIVEAENSPLLTTATITTATTTGPITTAGIPMINARSTNFYHDPDSDPSIHSVGIFNLSQSAEVLQGNKQAPSTCLNSGMSYQTYKTALAKQASSNSSVPLPSKALAELNPYRQQKEMDHP